MGIVEFCKEIDITSSILGFKMFHFPSCFILNSILVLESSEFKSSKTFTFDLNTGSILIQKWDLFLDFYIVSLNHCGIWNTESSTMFIKNNENILNILNLNLIIPTHLNLLIFLFDIFN